MTHDVTRRAQAALDERTEARRAVDLAMTEKQFQESVIDLAVTLGWFGFHAYDARRSAAGYPDLTLVHRMHGVVWLELKTMRGRVSAIQVVWLEALRAAGQRAYIFRPSDWPEIERILTGEEPTP